MFKEQQNTGRRFQKDVPRTLIKELMAGSKRLASGWDSTVYISSDRKYVFKEYITLDRDIFYTYVDLLNRASELGTFFEQSINLGESRYDLKFDVLGILGTGRLENGRFLSISEHIEGQVLYSYNKYLNYDALTNVMSCASEELNKIYKTKGIDMGVENVKVFLDDVNKNINLLCTDLCTYIPRIQGWKLDMFKS